MKDLTPPIIAETSELAALRAEVRAWIAEEVASGGFVPDVDSWMSRWDREFTRRLASKGWLGMTVPVEYGGHGRTFLERFVVTEELLAAGAPVTAHWFADRQVAPSLLRFGSEEQKRRFLPAIARGEILFAIGMSEPDSGSDLASVRTKGTKADGGWTVTGSKVWTSNAHLADWLIVLARTAPLDPRHRHDGLSQLLIDLRQPGVTVRPIRSLNGEHHFNEVFLDAVFVPDDLVLGEVGQGWVQVTSELAYERSGPERFLSTMPLLEALLSSRRTERQAPPPGLGRFFARLSALHTMSASVAGGLSRHERLDVAAALVKELGTATEADLVGWAGDMVDECTPERLRALTDRALLARPGFTLRGGTNEILRGVITRELGLR